MRIDAHHHFWRPERGDYGWLTPQAHPLIYRDYGPADLAPFLAAGGVQRTVLVQAAPSVEETHFLLEIAHEAPFVAAVVGWANLLEADAPRRIDELATHEKLRGLRPMLQDLPRDDWILDPSLAPALDAMEAHGLRLDALVKPRHLPHLAAFVAGRPGLPVVVDHGAKPDLASGDLAAWSRGIQAVAAHPQVFCKLSGLVTEAGRGWTRETIRPALVTLLEAFGPRRLMWGSDWPVVEEAGGYSLWRSTAEELVADTAPNDSTWIFGRAAEAFYGISE